MRTLRARHHPAQRSNSEFFKTENVMLSEWAISALGRAGIKGPIEDALKSLVCRNLNWKAMLKRTYMCGASTIREIETAARGLGYDTDVKLSTRAANIMRKLDVETVEDFSRFMISNGDWRVELLKTSGCGRMTIGEIDIAAQHLGIL